MIYLLYGENVTGALEKLGAFEARFRREVPDAWQQINFEDENLSASLADTVATSLFAKKDYYIIKHASVAEEEDSDLLISLIKKWKNDESVVVFFERGVPVKNTVFDAIKKAAKHEEFKIKEDQKKVVRDDRDLFLIGDLWGRREKAKLVVMYENLLRQGHTPDDILRTFLWHARNVCLAAAGKTAEMKPFVANKSRDQARNFSRDALSRAFRTLVTLDDKYKKESLETRLLHFFLTE